jgi:hypothetical protein
LNLSKPTAKWEVTAKELAKKAIKEMKLPPELLQEVLSKEDRTRYTSFKALMFVSEERPEVLYPHWNYFADMLERENTHSKYIAIYLIASLTRVDTESQFEKIFDRYYSLLDDMSVIPSAHVARNSGKIVKAKPELEAKITGKLLSIDETHHKLSHKELIKSEAIEAFNEYFGEAKDKKKIMEFVKEQLKSKSPKTRKNASEFLKRWSS